MGLDMMSVDAFLEQTSPYKPPPAKMINNPIPASDGIYMAKFHIECQAKGLTPHFIFEEPAKGSFHASVLIDQQKLDNVGPYSSKTAAKEAACQAAIAKLAGFADRKELQRADKRKAIPALRVLEHNTGEYASKSNTICQQKGLTSVITFEMSSKGGFSAAMTIDGELVGQVERFTNKKDAKEELCRLTCPKLLAMESHRKRKSLGPLGDLPDAPDMLKEQNWIGTLLGELQILLDRVRSLLTFRRTLSREQDRIPYL